jgi:hypothetical protein
LRMEIITVVHKNSGLNNHKVAMCPREKLG